MNVIAIDGPSGAGKSTIARAIAHRLGYIYVDTGALYRTLGYYMLSHGVSTKDQKAVEAALKKLKIEVHLQNGQQVILLNGEDIAEQIRSSKVSMAASEVSALPCVRSFLLDVQRDVAKRYPVVMDGRDIGTVVFPKAEIKIFLTASVEERAKRRHRELVEKGENPSIEQVLEDIQRRDQNDSSRKIAPLKKAKDAIVVDSSRLSIEETMDCIMQYIQDKPDAFDHQSQRFYRVGFVVCRWFFKIFYRFQIKGVENLPPAGEGFVLCCNHQSYLDPVLMGLGTGKDRKLTFMAKEELFKKPILGVIIRKLGAFPVSRKKGGKQSIEIAIRRIKQGRIVALFPEGTRSKNKKLLRPKSGIAVIAAQTGANVVPAAIYFSGKRPFSKISLSFGKMIGAEELEEDGQTDNHRQLRRVTELIWERVTELYETEKDAN